MKYINLLVIAIATLVLSSCGTQEAKNFNDKLVGIQMSLMNEVNGMKGDTTEALAKLTRIQNSASQKIKEAQALTCPKDGEAFKQAMIDDFDGIVKSYDVLIKMMNQQGNEEQLAKLQDEFGVWQKKLEVLDEKVMSEQKKFVSKYNIRLEKQ